MTRIAGSFRIVFFIQIWLMGVLMTIDTFYSYLSEAPFIILFMTGETRSSKMRSRELKRGLIVPFYRKAGPVKPQI